MKKLDKPGDPASHTDVFDRGKREKGVKRAEECPKQERTTRSATDMMLREQNENFGKEKTNQTRKPFKSY